MSTHHTEVYAWGSNHQAQLGILSSKEATHSKPVVLTYNLQILQISCGEDHVAILDITGAVHCMGSNEAGRLGTGNKNTRFSNIPVRLDSLSLYNAVQISCGKAHTCVVTEDGGLFSWGNGDYGALGTGNLLDQYVPIRVKIEGKALNVSCGNRHTGVVVRQEGRNKLMMCGAGDSGQLGTGRREREASFVNIIFSEDVKGISCGAYHSAVLLDNGSIYAMGANSFGQLGTGDKKTTTLPTKVSALESVKISSVTTGNHTAAVGDDGSLYVWGTGVFGEYLTPFKVNSLPHRVKQVVLGGHFITVLDIVGSVWAWGSNSKGELGIGNYESRVNPCLVAGLEGKRIRYIAAGENFVIALGEDKLISELDLPLQQVEMMGGRHSPIRSLSVLSLSEIESYRYSQQNMLSSRSSRDLGDISVRYEVLQRQYEELKSELSREKEYRRETEKQCLDLKNRLQYELSQKGMLEQKTKRLELSLEKRKVKEKDLYDNFEEKLKDEMNNLLDLFYQLEEKYKEQEEDLFKERNKSSELEREVEKLSSSQSSHTLLQDEIAYRNQEIAYLSDEYSKLMETMTKLTTKSQNKLDSLEKSKKFLENRVFEIEKKYENSTEENATLQQRVQHLESEISSIKQENKNLLAQLDQFSFNHKKLQDEIATVHNKEKNLDIENQELKTHLISYTKSKQAVDGLEKDIMKKAQLYKERTLSVLGRVSPFKQDSFMQHSRMPSVQLFRKGDDTFRSATDLARKSVCSDYFCDADKSFNIGMRSVTPDPTPCSPRFLSPKENQDPEASFASFTPKTPATGKSQLPISDIKAKLAELKIGKSKLQTRLTDYESKHIC
jgi:X-linked retinitis pigmentosa GTPase regulator